MFVSVQLIQNISSFFSVSARGGKVGQNLKKRGDRQYRDVFMK